MTQLVRFRSGANSGIAIETGKSGPDVICTGQMKEVKLSSHIRLLANRGTAESTCG
jgi:hypothetical protein